MTLFERDNRSVRLTDIGEELVDLAKEALLVIDQMRQRADSARDPFSGKFSLGFIPTIAPYLVPHFVSQCRTSMPKLDLLFQEGITERLNGALLSGDLDAAILATPPENPKLDVIRLYDEPFWVIFPKGHSLRMIKAIRTQDLPVDELLLLTEGHCFRDQAMDVCELNAAPEAQAIRATSLETLVNMVAAEQGVTLVPALAIGTNWSTNETVVAKKLEDPEAYRRIYLTFRKSFPRQELLKNISNLICANLPSKAVILK